jgi:hypothetical protein
MSGRKYT